MLFEYLGKILNVHYAAMKRDGLYLQMRGEKQMLGVIHSLIADVFRHGHSDLFFEYGSKISRAYIMSIGYHTERKICREIGIYHRYRLLHYG